LPFCIDWLPDGRLLIVSASNRLLLRRESDGSLVTHADPTSLSDRPWNEIVVDGRGNAYINNIGFDLLAGEEVAPGILALVTPDGSARQVADGVTFPNGMVVTPDNSTLILAESYGHRLTTFDIAADGSLSNRRVWADLGSGAPDGICLDAEGAVWYGDVPNKRCVRVREGGAVRYRCGPPPIPPLCNAYSCSLEILDKVNPAFCRSSCSGSVVETSYRNHCVIFIFTEGESLKTIAVLLLSLVLVDSVLASVIGQMKGIFVCDTKDTYNQAVDMIRQHNWDAIDRLVLSGRCTQISKGDVVVENVTSLTGLVRVHPHGKTTSWWASAEDINR